MGERLMIMKYTPILHTELSFSKPECMHMFVVYVYRHA